MKIVIIVAWLLLGFLYWCTWKEQKHNCCQVSPEASIAIVDRLEPPDDFYPNLLLNSAIIGECKDIKQKKIILI